MGGATGAARFSESGIYANEAGSIDGWQLQLIGNPLPRDLTLLSFVEKLQPAGLLSIDNSRGSVM